MVQTRLQLWQIRWEIANIQIILWPPPLAKFSPKLNSTFLKHLKRFNMWIPLFSSFCLFLWVTDLINHSASNSLYGYNSSGHHFCIFKALHLSVLSLSVGSSPLNPRRLDAFSFIHLFSWAGHFLTSILIKTQLDILCQTVVDVPLPSLWVAHRLLLYTSLCVPTTPLFVYHSIETQEPGWLLLWSLALPSHIPSSLWHPSQSLLVCTGCRGLANALQNMMALAGMGP